MRKGIDFIGVGVGAVITNDHGLFFIAKRGPKARNERGKWDFPGGSLDFGEKLADGIKREIKEEFDIEIEPLELFDVCDHIIPSEGQHWVSPTFLCKHVSGEPKIMEPEKCAEIKWVRFEDIPIEELTIASKANYYKLKEINLDKTNKPEG